MPARGPLAELSNKLYARFRRLMDGESLLPRRVKFRVAPYAWSVEELERKMSGANDGARLK